MRQLDQRRADRRRPDLVRLDRLRPFHRGPAVVAALLDAMDHLPQLPADVADEQLAGLAIEAHPPGVAEAVGPDLRPRSLHADERIVLGDGVVLPLVLAVHVDPQDGGEQVGDVLPGVERVGRVGAGRVAGGDVEHAVGAEVEVAAVVAALQEGEDDLLARRVDPRRVRPGDREPRHARAVRQVPLAGVLALQRVADEALAVLLEVGMEGQPVDRLDLLRLREQVNRLESPCAGRRRGRPWRPACRRTSTARPPARRRRAGRSRDSGR